MSSSKDSDNGPPPVPTGAVTVSVSTASKASSPFVEQAPQPPTDPEAVLRSRYGGLLANKKRGPGLHHKGGHLHQHFDSADWSMAKARTMATGNGEPPSSSSLSAAALPLLPLEEVAPPRLAPEPPAPRRASHLGEASK